MTNPTLRLFDWARTQDPNVLDTVSRAIGFSQQALRGQFRLSGDPYVSHCVEVALILAEHNATPEIVVTAVLHSVLKSRHAPSLDDVRSQFGETVAHLLAEFSTLNHREYDLMWENVDPRALQIKVADRLHNMRTIRHLALEPQRLWAHNTQELVAPLARALGMDDLARELDQLAFATLRSTDAAVLPYTRPQAISRSGPATAALRGTLRAGTLALPRHCRARWQQVWDGELYACTTVSERLHFVRSILLGLPAMALATRRTERR